MSWIYARAHGTQMTLGQAAQWMSPDREVVWCACVGPIPPDHICPCMRNSVEARALLRAAHIVARLLLDASEVASAG